MLGFVKFIIITIMVLWLIKSLIRLILPVLFSNLASKMQQQAGGQQPHKKSKPEGTISIDYVPPKPDQSKTDKLGDFVDYEEVKQ